MTPAELQARRAALGLSRERLAAALGVTSTTVWRWERGAVPLPRWVPLALATVEREHANGR